MTPGRASCAGLHVKAACNLGLAEGPWVVVEDSRSRVQVAHEAGIGYVAVLGPTNLRDKLARLVGVGATVESLRQLPNEWLSLDCQ